MSSIREITSSNSMPVDLAAKLGKNGIIEIISIMWQGYYDLRADAVIEDTMRENKITQEWFIRVNSRWNTENRASRISLKLQPITQYEDDTLAKEVGQPPTIDFCFRAWDEKEGYFGAECKNLYGTETTHIRRYIETGVGNYVNGRYGSCSSVSCVIGYVLAGSIADVVSKINEQGAISEYPTFLTKLLGIKEAEYRSKHMRLLDGMPITLHHLFFDFAA